MTAFSLWRPHYHKLLYLLKYPAWILTGDEKHSGAPISVAFAGFKTTKNYFSDMIFKKGVSERSLGTRWGFQMEARRALTRECSLLFCEVPRAKENYLPPRCDFWMPSWIEMEIDLTESIPSLLKRERYARIYKKIKRQELSSCIRSNIESFDDFYHNMYVPHARMRHDASAVIIEYEVLKQHFNGVNTELLSVVKDGKSIAGCMIDFSGRVQMQHMGVRNTSRENMQSGSSEACFFFSILRAKEKNSGRMSLGHCRPFLNDGGFRYKSHYGSRIASHHQDSGRIGVTVLKKSPAVSGYFSNNPFIAVDKDRYSIYASEDSAPGVHADLFVSRTGSCDASVSAHVNNKLSENIREVHRG